MSSFDLKSLYTNVPLDKIIEISTEQLNKMDKQSLKKESFVQLMKIATKEVEFSFKDTIFCQTDRDALGYHLGPTLANILMGYIELNAIPKFITKYPNTKYMRYVNDCFVITSCEQDNKLLFQELNEAREAIKFTNECEANNQLAFLDVLVVKQDDQFKTKAYRKPTCTNNYLNFLSFYSKHRKIGLIKTLYSRAQKICSPEFLEMN